MNNAALTYYERTTALLERVRTETAPHIDRAAEICANSIANKGLVFLFGNGHSRMMCEEMRPGRAVSSGLWRWWSWRSRTTRISSVRMDFERP
jgi:uncharacterized phosphosugar-binding protein